MHAWPPCDAPPLPVPITTRSASVFLARFNGEIVAAKEIDIGMSKQNRDVRRGWAGQQPGEQPGGAGRRAVWQGGTSGARPADGPPSPILGPPAVLTTGGHTRSPSGPPPLCSLHPPCRLSSRRLSPYMRCATRTWSPFMGCPSRAARGWCSASTARVSGGQRAQGSPAWRALDRHTRALPPCLHLPPRSFGRVSSC